MNNQIKLHFALGRSAVGPNAVDVCQQSQNLAYLAGSCVVVRSFLTGREHVIEASDSPLSCLNLSPCGRYVATGEEGAAHIRIHDVQPSTSSEHIVLSQHSHGVSVVKFIPNTPFLVSVGVQQDAQICFWNYQTKTLLETSKLAVNVKFVALSDDHTVLITAGEKHLKFWNLSPSGFAQSRSAILANQRRSTFTGCVFLESNRVLAVTEDGALVEFVNKKYVNAYQWNDVKPTCIALAENAVLLGCSSGTVALHSRIDLSPLSTLPLPIPFRTDPAQVTSIDALQKLDSDQTYSPVVAVSCTAEGDVVSVHADHSMYVHTPCGRDWRRLHSDISHSGEITSILACTSAQTVLPPDTFITGGTDGTVKIWHRAPTNPGDAPFPQNNLLSAWLKKVLFLHEENIENPAVSSLSLSPQGHQLVVGTRSGNLHVFDVLSSFGTQEVITAHDGDVLATCFSERALQGLPELFASAGRDGLIHIFLPTSPNFTHCGVVEEHSSAITTLVFVKAANGDLCLFSGAVNGNVLVHRVAFLDQETMEICRLKHISLQSPPISIAQTSQAVLVSSENGSIRYITPEGDEIGFAEVSKDFDRPVKATAVSVDSSGTLIAVSDMNETLLVRTKSGRAINRIAVGAKASTFSADGRKLLIATEYSCVFGFKLSKPLQQTVADDRLSLELRRSPSADSLLGSGSEGFVDEATTSNSQITEWDSDESERTQPEIILRTEASRSAFTVLPAQVTRRSTSNLLSTHDHDHTDLPSGEEVDESQSDFISRRDRLEQNLPASSKSMLNIRDGGVQLLPPSLDSERPNRRQRGGWGPPQPSPPLDEWRQPSAAFVHSWTSPQQAPQYVTNPISTPMRRPLQQYQRGLTEGVQRRTMDHPSSVALAQIQSIPKTPPSAAFRRDSEHRVSLSKRHMNGDGPKAVWSAHALAPRRLANPQTPSGAAASAITRRQSEKFRSKLSTPQSKGKDSSSTTPRSRADDYQQSPLHLRSRSQSPNHMALSQLASRELSGRRDSDMSYSAVSSRLAPASSRSNLRDHELRKSTDALNKIAALRKQMHQSTENLRKSTENLAVDENPLIGRARSISNLRGAQLETAGTFDADRIPSSLLTSRMMARSMGNVSQTGDHNSEDSVPSNRLQNTLSALRKASNPDLTQASLYDEAGITLSADKTRRRGAVQKKVERYHPRNRSGRPQTSEESDSNTSDASLLNQSLNRRLVNSALRSASSVEPRGLASRRMYEQVTPKMTPTRRSNYLTQKLATEDVPGPDLGSDDSPRSSVNASEWNSLLDDNSDCQQLVKHVQDCCDQHRVHTDRLLQARKMVEACSLTNDQKRIIMSQIDREMVKSVDKLHTGKRFNSDSNGNDYQPIKSVQALKQGFQNLNMK